MQGSYLADCRTIMNGHPFPQVGICDGVAALGRFRDEINHVARAQNTSHEVFVDVFEIEVVLEKRKNLHRMETITDHHLHRTCGSWPINLHHEYRCRRERP